MPARAGLGNDLLGAIYHIRAVVVILGCVCAVCRARSICIDCVAGTRARAPDEGPVWFTVAFAVAPAGQRRIVLGQRADLGPTAAGCRPLQRELCHDVLVLDRLAA